MCATSLMSPLAVLWVSSFEFGFEFGFEFEFEFEFGLVWFGDFAAGLRVKPQAGNLLQLALASFDSPKVYLILLASLVSSQSELQNQAQRQNPPNGPRLQQWKERDRTCKLLRVCVCVCVRVSLELWPSSWP